ncbi:hypothetical protein WA588_003378, partial [Blastocystis sp. NMH]
MPRIIDNPKESPRFTFSDYVNSTVNKRTRLDPSPTVLGSDNETASESETSPVLYSLRNRQTVSQSSQILFLSQLNDTINSPSTESAHSTPTLQVQGATTHQVALPSEGSSKVTSEKIKQPPPSLDLSQPLPETLLTSEMPTPADDRKQSSRSQKRVHSPSESLEDEGYYANVVRKFRGGSVSTNWIRRNLSMRDISFVLTQNAIFAPSGANKITLSQLLHDALEKKQIAFPVEKKENKPTLFLSKRWESGISVAPSIEILLCTMFPSLYRVYKEKKKVVWSWVNTSNIDVQRDFPFLHSLITKQLVPTPSFPQKTSDMIIDTLQKRLFAFNYWSKYNDTLFDFAIDDSIAIHVPSYQKQLELATLLISQTTLSAPLLTLPVLQSQGLSSEWAEVTVVKVR